MKKLLNSKFFIILGSTITLLIVLSITIFFLTKNNIKTFSKDGYVIIYSSDSASAKYYFSEGTSYKNNISSQIVFKDTDGEKISVNSDSFLHYTDGSFKFLKNGVIMDLESVDYEVVPYYNITNKTIIEYSKQSYYIENMDKTLSFNNIAGRISEDKYIFAGNNIKLQLSGNDNLILGDYFEVYFEDDGIVKVENQDISYQVTTENSYILVNDNIKIDFATKKIYFNNEEKLSLSEMTIDGNENIEIISEEKEETTDDNNNNGSFNDNNNNVNTENTQNTQTETTTNNTSTNITEKTSKEIASIDLLKAEVGVNNISATFAISDVNLLKNKNLVLDVINTDTNTKESINLELGKTLKEESITITNLSPNSNYLLSINEESDDGYGTQYFQKLFQTNNLGVSLKRKYITEDSVAYEAIFDEDTVVKSAKITLYDENNNQLGTSITVNKDNSTATFSDLNNNTNYNIVLDDIVMNSFEYNKIYSITKNAKTLKQSPYIEDLNATVNEEDRTFTLNIDSVIDPDDSITKYTYYIYNANDITIDNIDTLDPIKTITTYSDKSIELSIDNEIIKPNINYKFKVVAEYYDNEKYSEIETILSDNFMILGPSIRFEKDLENTTLNKIVGKLILSDPYCNVPISGRSCTADIGTNNNFVLDYRIYNSANKEYISNINFDPDTLEANISIDSLTANTTYEFNLYGNVDFRDGNGIKNNIQIGAFTEDTNVIDTLYVEWDDNNSNWSNDDPINISAKITSNNSSVADSLYYLTFNLYKLDNCSLNDSNDIKEYIDNLQIEPIVSKTISGNLKNTYYNKSFTINTNNTFDIINNNEVKAIDILKSYSNNNKLKNCYGISITNAYDENGIDGNDLLLEGNFHKYNTPKILLLSDIELPTIEATEIQNKNQDERDNKLSGSTVVGYDVTVSENTLSRIEEYYQISEVIYYVCPLSNQDCSIDNAIVANRVEYETGDELKTTFDVGYGTSYETIDNTLKRGNNYIFKVKFNLDTDADGIGDTYYPSTDIKTETITPLKQAPTYSIYILNTDGNNVKYKYKFYDYDNALYDNKLNYEVLSTNPISNSIELTGEEFTINNLEQDLVYTLSFKQALVKTSDNVENTEIGKYIYDGKYVYNSNTINYSLVGYDNDNRLRILILENDENQKYINRVSAYEVKLSATGVDDYKKIYSTNTLSTCTNNSQNYKCIIIDYASIKAFKNKNITVSLNAYYDTGIINNDFSNLLTNNIGYVLQTNNYYESKGKYLKFTDTSKSYNLSLIDYPSGIYQYEKDYENSAINSTINLKNKIDYSTNTLTNSGTEYKFPLYSANDNLFTKYNLTDYQINNKVLGNVSLSSSNNIFKFSSIIPKIEVTNTKRLVNGAVIKITPSGLDNDIIESEFKNENNKYYYYIKIYEDSEKSSVYKTEKLEINSSSSTINLTKYLPDTTYYFEVYAYLLRNGEYKETLLFDASDTSDYSSSLYEFSTLSASDIPISNDSVVEVITEIKTDTQNNIYASKNLKITFFAKNYIGEYTTRFELYEDENILINSTVTPSDSSGKSIFSQDVTNSDLVYGADHYKLKVYIITDSYEGTDELLVYDNYVIHKAQAGENVYNVLTEPSITITSQEMGINSLKMAVSIKDDLKVIKNGKYCVILLDESQHEMDGYTAECNLSVADLNKTFTYTGLQSDTLYTFRVYADVHMNNVNSTNVDKVISSNKLISTSTSYNVALGLVTAYGSKNNITLLFSGGVNIKDDTIQKIDYTIMEKKKGETGATELTHGSYDMESKHFQVEGDSIKFIIDPDGLSLQSANEYQLNITYWVEVDDELVRLNNKNYNYGVKFD